MRSDSFLTAEGVSHEYLSRPGFRVLDGVSVSFSRGQFTAVIGRNGSGKSTFARILKGLIAPTSGSVTFKGLPVSGTSADEGARGKVSIVFQNPDNQIVASTVAEDVAFGPENRALPLPEIRRLVDANLALMGLLDRAKSPPENLSGGQKQRLAIAGALALEPECLILDEPTSMLDPAGRATVMDAVKTVKEAGTAVIMVTHAMDEAMKAERLIVMDSGRVVYDGDPREFFSSPGLPERHGLSLPYPARIASELAFRGYWSGKYPLTARDLAETLCS